MSVAQYIPAIKYGNLVDNGDINPALTQSTTVSITSAQLLALASTPVTIVTSTIAGTCICVESMLFEFTATTTSYAAGGLVELCYNNNTAAGNILAADIPVNFITAPTVGANFFLSAASAPAAGITPVPNTGISLGVRGTTNFTTGTGTAKVILNYYIVTI